MNKKKESRVNVTLTLDRDQVEWLDDKAIGFDTNRSHVGRKIIRKEMESETKYIKRKVQA